MSSVAIKSLFCSVGQREIALLQMGLNSCHDGYSSDKCIEAYRTWKKEARLIRKTLVRRDHLHLAMKTSLTCDGVILPFLISDEFSLNFPTLLLELHL